MASRADGDALAAQLARDKVALEQSHAASRLLDPEAHADVPLAGRYAARLSAGEGAGLAGLAPSSAAAPSAFPSYTAEQFGARADALSAELRVELASDDDALGSLLGQPGGLGQLGGLVADGADAGGGRTEAVGAMASLAADFPLAPLDELDELGMEQPGFGGATDEFGVAIQHVE